MYKTLFSTVDEHTVPKMTLDELTARLKGSVVSPGGVESRLTTQGRKLVKREIAVRNLRADAPTLRVTARGVMFAREMRRYFAPKEWVAVEGLCSLLAAFPIVNGKCVQVVLGGDPRGYTMKVKIPDAPRHRGPSYSRTPYGVPT